LDLRDLEVPPTLHALVAARLDALPAADRSILQDAAVLGQSFTVEALTAMSGELPEALLPRLAALVRREILTLETDPRAPTRGQHVFVQALLREVAFATLPKRERRARHLAAARYFESLGDEEVAGVVATHFVEAYRAAPEGAEGEAVATQARISLLATAERARELGALGQAIDTLTSALDVTPDPAQRARLLERIGRLQSFHSDWEAGYANLGAAVDAYTALGDRIGVIRATALLIGEHLSATRIADAERYAAPIAEEMEALVAGALERGATADREAGEAGAQLAETMARLDFRRQRYADSIRWADRALALAEPLRLDETLAMALVTKGTALASAGQLREGIALLEGAVVDATAHRQNLPSLRALNNLASMTAETDPRASLERTKLGMATSRRLGLRAFDGYHAGNAAGAAEPLGEWAWLRETVGGLLEGEREQVDRDWLESVRDFATVWTGGPDVARAERLLANARQDNDYQSERNVSGYLARCAFAAGDAARALELAEPFYRSATVADMADFEHVGRYALHAGRVDTARWLMELIAGGLGGAADHHIEAIQAGIAALEGRRDDAVALYRSAVAGYRTFGLRFTFALVVFDMAVLLGPDDPAVRSVIDEGRGIFEELGAATLLAQLDALAVGPGAPQRQPMVGTSVSSEQPSSSAVPTPAER
jgi:tetratricopeptide (TPR) repeat protein